MRDNDDFRGTVEIPIERYEQLLDFETRTYVVVDHIINEEFCSIEAILRTLGTREAIKRANEISKQNKTYEEKAFEKFRDANGDEF